MQNQEVAFDDWEAEADAIEVNTNTAISSSDKQEPQFTTNDEKASLSESKQKFIEQIKRISNEQFQQQFKDKSDINRQIIKSPLLLKSQNDALQLSKLVSSRLKKQALKNEDKVLPENELHTFFEEMLQYLYPSLEWQNIEYMKEKLKIMKKNRKEEENRARKLRQKDQRFKKTHKVQQNSLQLAQSPTPEKAFLSQPKEDEEM